MSFFERWFGGKEEEEAQPDIRFGRYSDSYKVTTAYDAWDEALEQFEKENFIDSYRHFLQFLCDNDEDNVQWEDTEQGLAFELFQGSKRIVGWATRYRFRAEARVARVCDSRPELLRRLIEQNYSLRFSRYALDPDRHIAVVFDSDTVDASPYKLYYALKELATQADKQDDLLLEEFGQLESVDSSHLTALPPQETSVKLTFIHDAIRKALEEALHGALDRQQYPGGIAYMLLSVIYKIDYLIKPEGYTMETLERAHRRYFSKEVEMNTQEKNQMLMDELHGLLDRSEKDYQREMYRVKTTFGITSPVSHDRLVNLIDGELHHMDWYQNNDYPEIALAIPSYIIGYSLFNYAVPQPDRDFFHLYYRVTESAYFHQLGFGPDYRDPQTQKMNRRVILKAIDSISRKHRERYTQLRPSVSILQFDDLVSFARSFLLMVRDLDLTSRE